MLRINIKRGINPGFLFLTAALSIAMSVAANAGQKVDNESKEVGIEAGISMVSDYRWRGVSLSDENLAVQGGFSMSRNGFYGGVWSSNIDFANNVELDLYGGYNISVTDYMNIGLEVKYVVFPGFGDSDFYRVSPNISGRLSKLSWGLHFDYEPEQEDTFRDAGDNSYVWANASLPLRDQSIGIFSAFTLNGRIGYEDGVAADDKVDWLVDVSTSVLGLKLSIGYVDTNKSSDVSDAAAVFSVSKSF